jgi:hypothetical protein
MGFGAEFTPPAATKACLSFRERHFPDSGPGFAVTDYTSQAETLIRKPDTMRWNCAISLSFLATLLLLTACENASAPAPTIADDTQPPGASILGMEWVERRPTDVHYFAGGFLTLTLAGDSAVLIEDRFTDMIWCDIVGADTLCSNGGWQNRYVGPYSMDDSLLTLSLAFAGTTANSATGNNHTSSIVTVCRYEWKAGDPLNLKLTGLDGGDVFPGRQSLDFSAKARANPE